MFMTLGQVVKQYLYINGIKNDFFLIILGATPVHVRGGLKENVS